MQWKLGSWCKPTFVGQFLVDKFRRERKLGINQVWEVIRHLLQMRHAWTHHERENSKCWKRSQGIQCIAPSWMVEDRGKPCMGSQSRKGKWITTKRPPSEKVTVQDYEWSIADGASQHTRKRKGRKWNNPKIRRAGKAPRSRQWR